MSEKPDDIVGWKTIDTGERDPETGFPLTRREPLTRAEGDALWASVQAAKADREARMPDEQSAIRAMCDAYTRLRDFGWNDPIYCPKDGAHFQVIEAGSTGIHDAAYDGEWPKGYWHIYGDGDVWPTRPTMFKLYPADQAAHDARMKEAGERFRAMCAAGAEEEADTETALLEGNGRG